MGITLYMDERDNGERCLQIRVKETKGRKLQLRTIVMGKTGQGDIVFEPVPESTH